MSSPLNRLVLTEEEFQNHKPILPTHGSFKSLVGLKQGRLEVIAYYDKRGTAHRYLCNCKCGLKYFIVPRSSFNNGVQSCGCYNREMTSLTAQGNIRGSENKRNLEDKLKQLAIDNPTYQVLDARDEKVMSKWLFYCDKCGDTFECRYDNAIKHPSKIRAQKACSCVPKAKTGRHKQACFYILETESGYNGFRKFGITNHFEQRLEQLIDKTRIEFYPILIAQCKSLEISRLIEYVFKQVFTDKVNNIFDGCTETFRCMTGREIFSFYNYLSELSIEELSALCEVLKKLKNKIRYLDYKNRRSTNKQHQ